MTAATCFTPKSSSRSLWKLYQSAYTSKESQLPYLTSSRIVVNGNSGPYISFPGIPSLYVTGLALPYGLPKLFMQITKNLEMSNALPGPPNKGPHQSLTSALPVKAWHMTIALSRFGESFPRVLYASGTFSSVTPDSSMKEGIMAMVWSGIKAAKGFSGCWRVLSWTYSVNGSSERL